MLKTEQEAKEIKEIYYENHYFAIPKTGLKFYTQVFSPDINPLNCKRISKIYF
jgi:hypothetical protein